MKEEIDALLMFITFMDHGEIPYLEGCKNILVHLVLTLNMIFVTKLVLLLAATLQTPIQMAPTLVLSIYKL
jgi:hypothetical protein